MTKPDTDTEISQESLRYCVSQADELAACYEQQYPDEVKNPRRSVDLLLEVATRHYGKKVSMYQSQRPKDTTTVWGAVERYPDRYEIVYVSDLNFCWTRMVVCKEVFQILLDETKYRNMKLQDHLREMLGIAGMPTLALSSDSVKSESMALIAAMEFLFPYRERLIALPQKDDSLSIAAKFKVPQKYVDIYLSDTYMRILEPYSRLARAKR